MQYCQKTEKGLICLLRTMLLEGSSCCMEYFIRIRIFRGFLCLFLLFYFLFFIFLNFLFSTVHKGDRKSQQNHTRNTRRKKLNSAEKTKRRTCCIFSSVENLKILPVFYSWWKRNVKKYLP